MHDTPSSWLISTINLQHPTGFNPLSTSKNVPAPPTHPGHVVINTLTFQAKHFFKGPVRLTAAGPKSIDGLLAAHKDLCSHLASEAALTSYETWQDDDLLLIFRATILLFNQIMDPIVSNIFKIDLDWEVRRQSVLLVLISGNDCLNVLICLNKI